MEIKCIIILINLKKMIVYFILNITQKYGRKKKNIYYKKDKSIIYTEDKCVKNLN